MNEKTTFRVGSRKSQLAIIQTNAVIASLQSLYPQKKFEIVEMTTMGDKVLDKPLPKIGEKSLFTKELEEALLKEDVDFVVHSLKDLPTVLPKGLTIGAVLEREDARDALILSPKYQGESLRSLPNSSVIGTSSLRRTAQLHRNYPNLKIENIRGNLNTRLRKLDEDNIYAGIILAAAGIKRMNLEDRIKEYFDPQKFLYAVGQGAIAVECRSEDNVVLEVLENLNHMPTVLRVISERSFLKALGGGCSAPVAVHSTYSDNALVITGGVWSLDGTKTIQKCVGINLKSEDREPPKKWPNRVRKSHAGISIRDKENTDFSGAETLGNQLAQDMIKSGALHIVAEAKLINEKLDTINNDSKSTNDKNIEESIENDVQR